ncbi:rhodanese-like domain-containing protein [Paramicrobacterium chengjingii]|uniref:Rhodanese-like domain-containing protein n=1 Tax=Paramicrobacterium chengjingii TaxID=2769067 RepID=A0ABX6YLE3_9MICO|nr:rhodanese-like domain-containing protein [Microbacterium chengjingii]QPZ39537.1 rhodanese-like domain-containing protein [Microbacterium chengjingii]
MKEITVTELAERAKRGTAAIVDVREPDEWTGEHVEGAVNIPLSQFMEREGELPDSDELHIMCHSGGRSSRVTQYLEQKGVDAANVDGGIIAWTQAGLPVVSG